MLRSDEENDSFRKEAVAVGVVWDAERGEVLGGRWVCRAAVIPVHRAAEQGSVVVGDDGASLHTFIKQSTLNFHFTFHFTQINKKRG